MEIDSGRQLRPLTGQRATALVTSFTCSACAAMERACSSTNCCWDSCNLTISLHRRPNAAHTSSKFWNANVAGPFLRRCLKDTLGRLPSLLVEALSLSTGTLSTADQAADKFPSDGAQNQYVAFAANRNLGPDRRFDLFTEFRYDQPSVGADVVMERPHTGGVTCTHPLAFGISLEHSTGYF